MRLFKTIMAAVLFVMSLPAVAQTTTYDDLNFEDDSTSSVYKPTGKNYAFIKSKRGSEGMSKSPSVDSVLSKQINEIVLVFTEVSADVMAEREDANEERWRNLLATYPQLFQFSTTYKSVCQCKMNGDAEAFKQKQGFYIYYAVDEPKPKETKVAEAKAESKEEKKVEEKKNKKDKDKEEKSEDKKEATVKKEDKKKDRDRDKDKEKTKEKEKENEKETEAVATTPAKEETVTISDADFAKEKKKGYDKPKRAKDAKACRPPCYENGDEDLNNFFKDNITLSKKQKRHSKSLISTVRIQLNFDGSIKKAMVTGVDEVLNQQVIAAVKLMNLWNPAVKGGLTVKSEVKLTLKYDKETKAMKPFETMINPRPGPKCKCASDAELGIN